MIKELSFEENGQTKTIQLGSKVLKLLEKNSVAIGDIDSVAGHDELVIIWANPKDKWSQLVDDSINLGVMDSYNGLDKHVVVKNM